MIIKYTQQTEQLPTVVITDIPIGTVFSGTVLGFIPTEGIFLKIHSHLIDLNTFSMYGAGGSGKTGAAPCRVSYVKDYKPFTNSTLELLR
mgnify:CR=1 FL=1